MCRSWCSLWGLSRRRQPSGQLADVRATHDRATPCGWLPLAYIETCCLCVETVSHAMLAGPCLHIQDDHGLPEAWDA